MSKQNGSLGEAFPRELDRIKGLVPMYEEIGAPGLIALSILRVTISEAEQAWADQDPVAMLRVYERMRGTE